MHKNEARRQLNIAAHEVRPVRLIMQRSGLTMTVLSDHGIGYSPNNDEFSLYMKPKGMIKFSPSVVADITDHENLGNESEVIVYLK